MAVVPLEVDVALLRNVFLSASPVQVWKTSASEFWHDVAPFTVPTVRLPVEVAVVPGEVGDDAQVVGLLASHIAGVQQRRDAQLGLRDLKGLQVGEENEGSDD